VTFTQVARVCLRSWTFLAWAGFSAWAQVWASNGHELWNFLFIPVTTVGGSVIATRILRELGLKGVTSGPSRRIGRTRESDRR
jgi:hypothetical protein